MIRRFKGVLTVQWHDGLAEGKIVGSPAWNNMKPTEQLDCIEDAMRELLDRQQNALFRLRTKESLK